MVIAILDLPLPADESGDVGRSRLMCLQAGHRVDRLAGLLLRQARPGAAGTRRSRWSCGRPRAEPGLRPGRGRPPKAGAPGGRPSPWNRARSYHRPRPPGAGPRSPQCSAWSNGERPARSIRPGPACRYRSVPADPTGTAGKGPAATPRDNGAGAAPPGPGSERSWPTRRPPRPWSLPLSSRRRRPPGGFPRSTSGRASREDRAPTTGSSAGRGASRSSGPNWPNRSAMGDDIGGGHGSPWRSNGFSTHMIARTVPALPLRPSRTRPHKPDITQPRPRPADVGLSRSVDCERRYWQLTFMLVEAPHSWGEQH